MYASIIHALIADADFGRILPTEEESISHVTA